MSLIRIFRATSLGIALILPTLEDEQQWRVVLSQPIQNVLAKILNKTNQFLYIRLRRTSDIVIFDDISFLSAGLQILCIFGPFVADKKIL